MEGKGIRLWGTWIYHNGKTLLELSRLDIKAPLLDVTRQTVDVEKILFEGGKTAVDIDGNGRLNWSRFASDSRADDPASVPEASGPGTAVLQEQAEPPWKIQFQG